jgi:beta-glucanase (GH16 family)
VNSVDQAIWVYTSSGLCGTIYTDGGGEVDLLEFYPGSSYWNGKVAQSFHTADHPQDPYETVLDAKQWHIYFMEWDNTSVRIGVDGVANHTYAKSTGTCNDYPFQEPVALLLTTQVGSIGGGTLNSNSTLFEIDYVRYYQMENPNPSIKFPSAPGKVRVE